MHIDNKSITIGKHHTILGKTLLVYDIKSTVNIACSINPIDIDYFLIPCKMGIDELLCYFRLTLRLWQMQLAWAE